MTLSVLCLFVCLFYSFLDDATVHSPGGEHCLSGLCDIASELATGADQQALSKSYWVECSGQVQQSVSAELLLILMHILAQVLGSTHTVWYPLPLNTVLPLWDTGYHGRRNEGNFSLGKTRGADDTFPTAWRDESRKLKSTSMQAYFKKVPLPFSERNWTSTQQGCRWERRDVKRSSWQQWGL